MVDLFVKTVVVLVLMSGSVKAATIDPDLDSAFEGSTNLPDSQQVRRQPTSAEGATASLRATYASPSKSQSHLSLLIPSMVVHGFAIDKDVADQMPRKVDGGQTVVTPGVGLEYVSTGGFLMIGAMFKDCYDNFAGTVQLGQQFRLGSRSSLGYSLGIYSRETPIGCQTKMDRRGRKVTSCEEFDSYRLKWMTEINGESVDIIPMPFLHLATALYKDRDLEVDLKIMTNFALNEFGLSIPF